MKSTEWPCDSINWADYAEDETIDEYPTRPHKPKTETTWKDCKADEYID